MLISQKILAYVDLGAIKENARTAKTLSGCKLCAVVKANAYGHGTEAVANALYPLADMFAVALICEAVSLRTAGIDKDILLLIPEEREIERVIEYDLISTIESTKQLEIIEKTCKKLDKSAKVHIKFNSGMNRLGCDFNELIDISNLAKKSKYIIIDGIYSHFFMPQKRRCAEKQYNSFLKAQDYIKANFKNVTAHLSASGAILENRKYAFDMVRAGIMLYGYAPFKKAAKRVKLKRALSIKADVINTRALNKGDSFLYGGFKIKKSMKASIVRLGYADGFFRKKNKFILNNRCMDVSGTVQKIGGYCIDNFEELAKTQGTIVYEVLCSVTKRADFIYFN